ncbi:MAG: hypothetical protein JO290_11705 [Sphingomonadaceae bacterium]|nr:hypothetical protein [Sphingomonadaceae bacterium]
MRRLILASVAAATFATAATAQETCEERRDNRTAGTVVGAGVGAILGGAIGGNALGAVLGGVGGGVAGNQLAKGPRDCVHAYGFYDNGGRWHPNRVDPSAATGFYDRDGRWVEGAPAGYYDRDGRWVPGDASRGYRDRNGYWVPAGAPGYYAEGGYVTAQPVAQEGYGRPDGDRYAGGDRPYGGDRWDSGDPSDVWGRINRTSARIDRSVQQGLMTQDQAYRARRDLDSIRRQARTSPRYGGQLTPRSIQLINDRLTTVNARIRDTRDQNRGNY